MGQVFGGVVRRGPVPMHGKVSTVHTDGKGLFEGLPRDFEVTRYHSLVVGDERWPSVLEKTAWTDDGVIMGLKHRDYPCWGSSSIRRASPPSMAIDCSPISCVSPVSTVCRSSPSRRSKRA